MLFYLHGIILLDEESVPKHYTSRLTQGAALDKTKTKCEYPGGGPAFDKRKRSTLAEEQKVLLQAGAGGVVDEFPTMDEGLLRWLYDLTRLVHVNKKSWRKAKSKRPFAECTSTEHVVRSFEKKIQMESETSKGSRSTALLPPEWQ